ncbi:MAG TPA: hypothetical protein VH500_19370 [Nitrososphaeraceae archaeon]
MSTVSKSGMGIQSSTNSEDYFICRLCLTLVPTDEMVRHLRTCHIIQTDIERME